MISGLQVLDSKSMRSYRHGTKCMMLKGGSLVFHLSALSLCFDAGLPNFTSLWSIFESFVVDGAFIRGI